MIELVRKILPLEKQFTQLAEEATELAHAALKVARTLDDSNPTPVTYDEAMLKLHEEIADVKLVLMVLDLDRPIFCGKHVMIMSDKLRRWVHRLTEVQNGKS